MAEGDRRLEEPAPDPVRGRGSFRPGGRPSAQAVLERGAGSAGFRVRPGGGTGRICPFLRACPVLHGQVQAAGRKGGIVPPRGGRGAAQAGRVKGRRSGGGCVEMLHRRGETLWRSVTEKEERFRCIWPRRWRLSSCSPVCSSISPAWP